MTVDELNRLLQESPFHRLLAMTVSEIDSAIEQVTIRLAFSPALTRDEASGQFHGGVLASLIDIAGDFALIAKMGKGVPTINFRVDYLRPAIRTDLKALARVRKAGRTVGVVDVEVLDSAERLVAIGRGCYGTQPG